MVNNSFFVLYKINDYSSFKQKEDTIDKLTISRMHLCTWDFLNKKTAVELGFEIQFDDNYKKDTENNHFHVENKIETLNNVLEETGNVEIYINIPWINGSCKIKSLDQNLSDSENAQFIFNEKVERINNINGDKRNGYIVDFQFDLQGKRSLMILPVKIEISEKYQSIILKAPIFNRTKVPMYFRIFIETNYDTLATIEEGLAKKDYIFDIKINEKRNLPENTHNMIQENHLKYCNIKHLFCFHVLPNSTNISYINSTKLKNIRLLEVTAFKKYLKQLIPITDSDSNNKYFITFTKDSQKDSYSFFSIFTKEKIGKTQILIAILINLTCGILAIINDIDKNRSDNESFFSATPLVYHIYFIFLIFIALYIVRNIVKKPYFLKK